jgi:hypothetical protein
MEHKKLARWLAEQCARTTAGGAVVRLELRHLAVGNAHGAEVDLEQVPEQVDAEWAAAAAARMHRAAGVDANGIGDGAQRYALHVYRANAPESSAARYAFVIAAVDLDERAAGFESEPPTATGLTAMLMRHLEAKERVFVTTMGTLIHGMRDRNESLEAENRELRASRLKTLELVEQVQSMAQEREIEAKRAEAQIEALRSVAGDVKLLLPALAARLSGAGKGAGAGGDADLAKSAITRLLGSLTPAQQAKIAETLTPAQQIALMELVPQPDAN